MMLNTLLPILLFAALALAVIGAGKRFLMWRRGRPSRVDWLGGLLAMPRRYMVDLHHVVARDKYIANTHVATAGGFVLAAVLAIVVHGFGLHSRILGVALLAACALMFGGPPLRRPPPPRPAIAAVERPVDAPAEKPADVLGKLLYRHPAGGRDSAGRLFVNRSRRLDSRPAADCRRGLGRVGTVLRHDLGRADEARLCRCPAPGLAPPQRTLRWRSFDRTEGAEPG